MFKTNRQRLLVMLAGATFFAAGPLASTVATAASRPSPAVAHHSARIMYGPASKYALSNWGGYIAEGSTGEFTKASAHWTIASVTCNSDNNLYAPWVGIDGDGDSSVEQTGVQTDCSTGSPVSSAWYEMYPAAPVYFKNAVATGDEITASVTYTGGKYTIVISDKTAKWTHTVHKSLTSDRLSAEAVIESPPSSYPTFTSVNFTNVKFNNADLDTFNPTVSDTGTTSKELVPTAITNGYDFSMVPKS